MQTNYGLHEKYGVGDALMNFEEEDKGEGRKGRG
jgi:hypothetical protein